MLSNKPYLMRAFYDWITDSECTPILVLDATNPRCIVPDAFIEGGEIVFNISPVAIRDLRISNQLIEFKASFNGYIHDISAPVSAVLAVYAEENGEGLFFDAEDEEDDMVENKRDTVVQLRTIEGNRSTKTVSDEDTLVMKDMIPPGQTASAKSKPSLKLVE